LFCFVLTLFYLSEEKKRENFDFIFLKSLPFVRLKERPAVFALGSSTGAKRLKKDPTIGM